jgi:hypothetical protein
MARTPLGQFQRSVNGRFLYGRPKNYRLASCLAGPVNYNGAAVPRFPGAGAAPLAVTFSPVVLVPTPITPGMQSNWPAPPAGGMSSLLLAGGIATQVNGYPRTGAAGTPIIPAVSVSIDFDDATADSPVAAYGANVPHNYVDPGSFAPVANSVDGLGRVLPHTTDTVVAA